MAKPKASDMGGSKISDAKIQQRKNKRTSIGKSKNSRPNHKNAIRHKGKSFKRKKNKH